MTTHPDHPESREDRTAWRNELTAYCARLTCISLTVSDTVSAETEAFVTFLASLLLDGKDISFTERSRFVRLENRWLYIDGQIS